MKKKILYILVAAILYILTQVPTIVSNYKFEAGIWDIELCRYVLMSVGWMIVILYVIHFVLDYIKNMAMNNIEEPLGVLLLCLVRKPIYYKKQ